MTATPLVSILTPTYNRADLLPEAMASVLAQDYPALEHLVLDDGSTDGTPELLARCTDRRVRTFRHDNMGQARTLNRGFELARGELLMVLNSDDLLLPGAVRLLAEAFSDRRDLVAVYGDYERMDELGAPIGPGVRFAGSFADMLRHHVCPGGPAVMFRRAAQRRIGGWDPAYRFVPDYDFLLRLGLLGPFRYVPGVLARFRVHGGSVTASERGLAMAREQVRAIETFFERPDLPVDVVAVRAEALRSVYIEAGLIIDDFPNFPGERFQVQDRFAQHAGETSAARPSERTPQAVIEWLHREVAARHREIDHLHAAVAERDAAIAWLRGEVAARDQRIAALERTRGETGATGAANGAADGARE